MRTAFVFLAGVVVGIAMSAAAAWAWVSHEMRTAIQMMAESPPQNVLDRVQQLANARAKLDKAQSEYDRWVALGDVGLWSVDAGDLEGAKQDAEKVLDFAGTCPKDWNYGNAILKGNLILGRIALRHGDKDKAKEYLLAAGRTPGSPQLDSFGPNMILAKELLEAGEKEAVLQYLDLCGKFWKNDLGALEIWRHMIKQGKTPNFGGNLLY